MLKCDHVFGGWTGTEQVQDVTDTDVATLFLFISGHHGVLKLRRERFHIAAVRTNHALGQQHVGIWPPLQRVNLHSNKNQVDKHYRHKHAKTPKHVIKLQSA